MTAHVRAVHGQSTPDPELVLSVAAGDLDALGELYSRYARDVWRAVLRVLPDGAHAEDVVHTAFMKLPEIAASYDGRARCRNWLCGIGVRLALRHRRGAGRFRRMLRAFTDVVVVRPSADPERGASNAQELAVLERALAKLGEKKRAVFVLVELEQLSTEEAAKALEIPPATVRTRLFHARQELQEALRKGGAK
ncbi:MAG: sigma-70 family RNA polymerase sigma factor [Polyangiaceae bacterium]